MKELLATQTNLTTQIANAYTNLLEKGRENINMGAIKSRILLLESYIKQFRDNHETIRTLDNTAFKNEDYFAKEIHEQVEEIYCDFMGIILQEKHLLNTPAINNPNVQTVRQALTSNNLMPSHRKMAAII